MELVVKGFMVDMQVDSKNSSVAGQGLYMCLKLVDPEYMHKRWNKQEDFLVFLREGVFLKYYLHTKITDLAVYQELLQYCYTIMAIYLTF